MQDVIEAYLGFSQRADEPLSAREVAVPGYPDNRVLPTACAIRNARAAEVSLDEEGFFLLDHQSAFAGERDRKVLDVGYHREMAAFLREHLGAAVVRPSSGSSLLVRYGERLVGRRPLERPTEIIDDRIPASFAHIDYYPEAAVQSASHFYDVASRFARMMIVQTWRAVSGSPQDVPLAICDRRSLAPADISPCTGVLAPENSEGLEDPRFVVGGIHYNPTQKWYYFPDMQPDEVLVFTGYDSAAPDGWKVGHGAFDNRHNHAHALPRVSIEARFYAFFD